MYLNLTDSDRNLLIKILRDYKGTEIYELDYSLLIREIEYLTYSKPKRMIYTVNLSYKQISILNYVLNHYDENTSIANSSVKRINEYLYSSLERHIKMRGKANLRGE